MIVLHTIGCRNCAILEGRLKKDKIDFEINTNVDIDFLVEKGFTGAPVLQIDDEYYTYEQAMKMLQKYEKTGELI